MNQRLTAYLLLLVTAIIWGIASPVIKYTLSQITPFAFLFYRFLITSAVFLPFFLVVAKKEKETLGSLFKIAPLGFLGVSLTLSLIFLGLEKTTALEASVLVALAPIFIIVAGVLFLKEEVTKLEQAGIALAFSGPLVMILQPLVEEGIFVKQNLIGNLLILASNITWTAYVIGSKEEFKRHSPFVITATAFIVGLITIAPFALYEQGARLFNFQELVLASGAVWGVLYMSLFSSVVAYYTFQLGLKLIEASEATLFAYLQPVFAAPLALFWLGEKITPAFLVGALLIAAGIVLAEYRPEFASWKKK